METQAKADTIQSYKDEYQSLKTRHDALNKDLSGVNADIRKLLENLAFEVWGIKVGILVTVRDKSYQVASVDIRQNNSASDIIGNKPWCMVHPIKKDGTPSKAERYLYSDWVIK